MELNPQYLSFSQMRLKSLSNFNVERLLLPREGVVFISDEEEAGVTDACWKHQSPLYWQTDLHLLKYGNLEDAATGVGCPNPFALLAQILFCTDLSSVLGQV